MTCKSIIYIVIVCCFFSCINKKDNNSTNQVLDRIAVCEGLDYTFKNDKVYFIGNLLVEGADANSFTCLGEEYAKDKNYVYFGFKPFKIADVATFEFLGYHYSKDKNNVYFDAYLGHTIKNVDAETFEVINISFFKDKNHVYRQSELEKDKLEKIEHLNPKTFRPLGTGCYQDERFFYNAIGERLGELGKYDDAYINQLCGEVK